MQLGSDDEIKACKVPCFPHTERQICDPETCIVRENLHGVSRALNTRVWRALNVAVHFSFVFVLLFSDFCAECSYFRRSGRVRGKRKYVKNVDM